MISAITHFTLGIFNNFTSGEYSVTHKWWLVLMLVFAVHVPAAWPEEPATKNAWTKKVIWEGGICYTAITADFTKDGIPDIIADAGKGVTRLFVGPDWKKQIIIDDKHLNLGGNNSYITSDVCDLDGDGDADYIAACFNPGVIVWYEQPERPLEEPWKRRVIENQLNGVHSVIHGDVDKDGRMDLLATSDQPKGRFPNSLVWLSPPAKVQSDQAWQRHILADRNAPGISHYLALGDFNGDGRPDVVTGAKGGPTIVEKGTGQWFAWWASPTDPTQEWTKHDLPGNHLGATNILPGDINGDGKVDFLATRGHGRGVIWFEAPDWKIHTIDAEIKEPHCLQVEDIDGDGDLDAVTCAYGSKICVWYENDGSGRFSRHVVGMNQEAYDIRVADLDGDGDKDFLVAGRESNNVVIYLNPKTK